MLNINISPTGKSTVRVIMTGGAGRAVGEVICSKSNRVTMRMAAKVVSRMTLRTVASRCCWSICCCVMTGCTAVMFLVVRSIDKVRVIDRLGMTAAAFCLLRDLGRMILCHMCAEITGDTAVTLATITSCRSGQLGGVVVTDVAVVMFQVIRQIYKVHVVDGIGVTACTTGGRCDLARMILSMRAPVTGYPAMTHGAVAGARRLRAVGRMARGTGVMLLVVRRVDEVLARGQRRGMAAGTLAVQGDIADRRMIDVMVRPDATGMTGRTGVRTAFMACCQVNQRVRRCVMTGCTAVMDLVVAAVRKGR